MLNEPRIIIVGAGAAGFSAASRLLEKGLQNITILEATSRIGGRVHTVEFAENVVDLGAQWVHGEHGNIIHSLASPQNLLSSWEDFFDFNKHKFFTAKGEMISTEEGNEILQFYFTISDDAKSKLRDSHGSYGEYFTNEFYKYLHGNSVINEIRVEAFLEWLEKFDNSIQGSDTWYEVSAKGLTHYQNCDGDLTIDWKDRGYKTIFDLLSQKYQTDPNQRLPIAEKIKFNKVVTSIDYNNEHNVVVKTSDGCNYTTSHVIFTASLGVLKEKHSKIFTPLLSEKKQCAIGGLGIGTVNKVFLEFSHKWWREDDAVFNFIWSKEDKTEFLKVHGQENQWLCNVFAFFTVNYQPRVLCAWITGPSARYIESLKDIEIHEGLYLLLENFLNRSYNVPKPVNILRSKWYTNEHFRGSYSFRSLKSEHLNVYAKDLAEPIKGNNNKPVILFAGEATHDHYYSTVHGAVETGFREADRLIDYYR